MTDPRIRLKNSLVAGVLALLLPGLGHAYQGRWFKAAVYCVCILGLFFTGMAMAGWQAIQTPTREATRDHQVTPLLKYAAQLPVGAPVMLAWVQRSRLSSPANVPETDLAAALTAEFTGTAKIWLEPGSRQIDGTIVLTPVEGQFGRRGLAGEIRTSIDGQPATLKLTDDVKLDKPIQALKLRTVHGGVAGEDGHRVGDFNGQIPRPALDWLGVPMDENQEQQLHGDLGKYHELAMVFTWVAGLLNVLAIWDAIDGPAYGYDMASLNPDKQPAVS